MKFILLVTWFVVNQPPSSSQTAFDTAQACERARISVLAEGVRLKTEYDQRTMAATGDKFFTLGAPTVSAVCVGQQ